MQAYGNARKKIILQIITDRCTFDFLNIGFDFLNYYLCPTGENGCLDIGGEQEVTTGKECR